MILGMTARWLAGPAAQAEDFDFGRLQGRTRAHVRAGKVVVRAGLIRERTRQRWLSNVVPSTRLAGFTGQWNLAGYPAITVPMGRSAVSGLPTSVQLVARPGGESLLLGLAAQLESANPWPRAARN